MNNLQGRTQTTRGESRGVNPKSGQVINNNINIINNITQITYHTNPQETGLNWNVRNGEHHTSPKGGKKALSPANAAAAEAEQHAIQQMMNIGLSREEIQKHLKNVIHPGSHPKLKH